MDPFVLIETLILEICLNTFQNKQTKNENRNRLINAVFLYVHKKIFALSFSYLECLFAMEFYMKCEQLLVCFSNGNLNKSIEIE